MVFPLEPQDISLSQICQLSEKLLLEGAFFNNPPIYLAKRKLLKYVKSINIL